MPNGFPKILSRSVLPRSLPPVVYLLGIVYFLSGGDHRYSFPLDDAWIHRVYARAFATGDGFAYNPGVQEAGATSPLWVIVTSPAHWLEPFGPSAVVLGVKIIAIILGMVAIMMFSVIVRHVTKSPLVGTIAACLFALEPRFLFSSLSGMETPLLMVLWLGGLYAFLKKRWIVSAALLGLTPVTRPESLVLLPVFFILFIFYNTKSPIRNKIWVGLVLGFPFVVWAIFCKQTTGHWLPNTYYLKSHAFQLTNEALSGGWRAVTNHGFASLFISFVGVAVCAVYLYRFRRLPALVFLVVGPLVYLVGVIGSRPPLMEGYYFTRWIDPPMDLLTAAFALGYSLVLSGNLELWRVKRSRARIVVIAAGVIGILVSAPGFADTFEDRRSHLITDSRAIDKINVAAGLWIGEHTPPNAVVGVNDAGAIRYFGGRYTVDLLGINNQDIAFRKVNPLDVLLQSDWLVIFPSVFAGQQALIEQNFELVKMFQIPLEEYTICDCPGQTTKVIARKKS